MSVLLINSLCTHILEDRGNRDVHADQETEIELDRTYTEERT